MSDILASHIETLIDDESKRDRKPFPNYNIYPHVKHTPTVQLSLKPPSVNVIVKGCTNWIDASRQDEESNIESRIVCWSDISAMSKKLAFKTVRAGIEREYRSINGGTELQFTFSDVTFENHHACSFYDTPADITIFHIFDPVSVYNPQPIQRKAFPASMSASNLAEIAESTRMSDVVLPPIQFDIDALRFVSERIHENAIIILDCNGSERVKDVLLSEEKPYLIFWSESQTQKRRKIPLDLFTSCLLTPSRVAIITQWNSVGVQDTDKNEIEALLDRFNESSSDSLLLLLGKALDAFVGRIARERLPPAQFLDLFRKDIITAKFIVNFFFAQRVMHKMSIFPHCHPDVPDISDHPIWESFDLQVDRTIYSMREMMKPKPRHIFTLNEFLEEQIKYLEGWMWFPTPDRKIPIELPVVNVLLSNPDFFDRAVTFCATFIRVSSAATQAFLRTRSLPVLETQFEFAKTRSDEIKAAFSMTIFVCLVFDLDTLRAMFEEHVDFWLDCLSTDNEDLLEASIGCLLLLYSPEKREMYLQKINGRTLMEIDSDHIRCLSHLLLSRMCVPLEEIRSDDKYHFCRAALIHRASTTLQMVDDQGMKNELMFNLIFSLNDVDPLVRIEAIVSISHCLTDDQKTAIQNNDDSDPLVNLLRKALDVLKYETSKRVQEKMKELNAFLRGERSESITSELVEQLTTKYSTTIQPSEDPVSFESTTLGPIIGLTLIGQPSLSPSGNLACADDNGQLLVQMSSQNVHFYEYFSDVKSKVKYTSFIDDRCFMSVSDHAQVIVVDSLMTNDVTCSFLIGDPSENCQVVADFNASTYQMIGVYGRSLGIFDLAERCKICDLKVGDNVKQCNWLHSYSTLFTVVKDNEFQLFDSRMKSAIASIDSSPAFLGCNTSSTMPLYLVKATSNGEVSMLDLRSMAEVTKRSLGKSISHFEVHQNLPFALASGPTSLFSVSFENGMLSPTEQTISKCDGFALHQSDPWAAVRAGNEVFCLRVGFQ